MKISPEEVKIMSKKEGLFSRLFARKKTSELYTAKPPEEMLAYELQIIEGDDSGKSFDLGENSVFIGRKLPGDKRIDMLLITDREGSISGKQARIFWNSDRKVHIIDSAGSSKPTIVNGIAINKPACLKEGSYIVMGRNTLLYKRKDIPSRQYIQNTKGSDIQLKDIQDFQEVNRLFDEFSLQKEELPSEEFPSEEYIFTEENEHQEKLEDFESGYTLKVISGLEEGKEFELNNKLISIGKLTAMERKDWILLDTSTIAIDQATLKWMDKYNKFGILHTRGSIAPTYVNDREISDEKFTLLRDGDIIGAGKIRLMVRYKVSEVEEEPDYIDKVVEDFKRSARGNADFRVKDIQVRESFIPSSKMLLPEIKDTISNQSRVPPFSKSSIISKEHKKSFSTIIPAELELSDIGNGKDKDQKSDQTLEVPFKEGHMFQIVSGPDKDRVFTISKAMVENKLIIGRKEWERKDIEIADDNILDRHASLTFEDIWLFINLEDERGELLVNGLSIMRKGLEDGDIIKIGNTVMEHYLIGSHMSKGTTLEIIEGPGEGLIFSLKKKLIHIGRKSQNNSRKEIELPRDDRSVSRNHARIEKKGNKYYLINEKVKNLTFLNGVYVTEPRRLVNGDRIQIGNNIVFLYRAIEAPVVIRGKQREIKKEIKYIEGEEVLLVGGGEIKSSTDEEASKDYEEIEEEDEESNGTEDSEEDMILIPEGEFLMGTDHIECDANPRHSIMVKAFYIDKYPVTNDEYSTFVNKTNYESEDTWKEYFTEGKENYPVVAVTYNDAKSYASWKGKRLTTEAEWEKAARGDDGRLYPWGNKWDPSRLCSKDGGSSGEVDSYLKGASPYGVMNMLGTVWEWTSDHYSSYPYKPLPVDSLTKEVVIRGGDVFTELKEMGLTIRAGIYPDEYVDGVGFRCAKDVKSEK